MRQYRRHSGPPCPHYPKRFKTEAAHVAHTEANWRYDERRRQEREPRQFAAHAYPLRLRLQRLLATIRQRCRVRKNYAGRGIQCHLNYDHLLFIWKRDGAARMQRPSIDRRDNDGHYELGNVRFIELADNIRHGVKVREGIRLARHRPQPAGRG